MCIVLSDSLNPNGHAESHVTLEIIPKIVAMETFAAVRDGLRVSLSDHLIVTRVLADAEDPVAFAAQLLAGEARRETVVEVTARAVLSSFPSQLQFLDHFSAIITTWFTTERCPLLDQPPLIDGVNALTASRDLVLGVPVTVITAYVSACLDEEDLSTERVRETVITLLEALGGARGILTCLGFRETPGSRVVAPLTHVQCLASFLQLQSTKEKLTVGARAFTKHCQRSSDGFWGELKGNDLMKNATALARVQQLLDAAVWKNVHSLPHGEVTLEIRNAQGYGARWYIRDQSFRGFLEPQMENGHENRWRH